MEYKKSHTGDDSNTRPKSSTLGRDAKKILILNQNVINDLKPKPKCCKIF
jgi:hypothetical protein